MDNLDKLYFCTNKSPIRLFYKILFGVLLFDILLILIFSIVDYISFEKYIIFSGLSFEEHVTIILLFIHFLLFILLFIQWFFESYKISREKVEYSKGIFFKRKQLFIIDKIDSITINQSFFGRILNYGNISFYYNDKEFFLNNIPYPEEFIEFLDLFKNHIKS